MGMRGSSGWWSESEMARMGWVLLVGLQLGALGASVRGCGSVEYYVPRDHGDVAGVDHLVEVTYSSDLFGGNSSEGGSESGAFLQCCRGILPDVDLEEGNGRICKLNCSVGASTEFVLNLDSDAGGSAAAPDFCVRFNSSSTNGYIVGKSGRGAKNRGCELKAEAVLSLSLYLKWFWPVALSADSRIANRLSFLGPVQTRADCSNADVGDPCRLTISTNSFVSVSREVVSREVISSEVISRSYFPGVLGTVEWIGALSSERHVLLSHDYEAALSSQTKGMRSVGPDQKSTNPGKDIKRKSETKMFDFALTGLSPVLSIQQASKPLGASAEVANALGRRSLIQARVVEGAHSDFQWSIFVLGTLISLAGISMLAALCAGKKEDESPAEFLDTVPILPPRFSYSKLQKATKNYSQKLGDGAFGSVYEGTMPNGTRVAVKMLEKTSVQGEKQFRAEVASMGAIRHLNLVRLHGFCSEGAHRLLVYEYMPNGSLDSWLFGKKQGAKLLDWEQRLNIALGTARALAYLHEECSDHIIHLDVKPENILLDHQFCPKLSDFGLAKLMDREQSRVVTSMRGTPGYLAPEWLLPHAAVTAKTDVYSFGMVLLELLSGRENTNFSLGKEQWYFPAWAFKLMGESRTMELLDKRLHVEEVEYFHKEDAVRAIHVALLCIQDDPEARPPMSRVVHMLQGHVEPEPLNAQQAAIQPPRRLVTAFAASVCDKNPSSNPTSNGNSQQNSNEKIDSRKNSWSNDHLLKHDALSELQNDVRNDHYPQRNDMNLQVQRPVAPSPVIPSRLPAVSESPRVIREIPKLPPRMPPHQVLEDLEDEKGDHFMLEPDLPAATQVASQYRSSKGDRMAGVHTLGSNPKCIPPWPVKGDVILLRGPQGDFHGVVRDVRVQTKMMRLGLLHRQSSESRWSVREEESTWRHWNDSIRTLDFWVTIRWATIPGRGMEKFPVEWQVK